MWDCRVIGEFWSEVLTCLEEVLEIQIPRTPKCIPLHSLDDLDGNRYKHILLWLCFSVAKRDIAQMWKAEGKPALAKWENGMDHCMALEKLI